MRSPQEPLVQLLHDARLANTRFAREQHRLTFTGYDPFETVDEQRDFVLPPNKSGQANSSCFEAAFDRPLGEHLPGAVLDLERDEDPGWWPKEAIEGLRDIFSMESQ